MQEKGLIHTLGEWLDNRPKQSSWSKWLPTPGNMLFTLLMIGLLIVTQRAWANTTANTVSNVPPSATTINYQGRLADDNGLPLTGNYTVEFAIYDAPTNGNLIWGTETHANVPVSDGLFNVGLGSLTSGGIPTNVWSSDRYLQVTVEGEPLTPRELIRSVPVAGMALTALSATIAMTSTLALTVPDGSIMSNQLNPTRGRVSGLGEFNLTEQYQTIASTTLTVDEPSQAWIVATCDCYTRDGALITGGLWVNNQSVGASIISGAWATGNTTGDFRQTVSNSYIVDLTAGENTLELKAKLYDSTGSALTYSHSGISYIVFSN